MTTHQPFPKNKVILYGKIDQQRQSASERRKNTAPQPSIRTFRNTSNGSDYSVSLQVAAPYGGSYQIEVDVGMVDGAEILTVAKAGQLIVVEGYLTRTREVDRRFRDFEEQMIEGIFYQDVSLQVERVRPHQELDPQGTGTNIWIEGTVIEPPVFFRHPEFPDIELARVGVRARTKADLSETGVVRPGRPCDVTVIIPTDDENVGYLYRRGNQLRLRGVLERVAMRQFRDEVRERVTDMESAWEGRRAEIRAMDKDVERTLAVEGGRFLRDKERTERAPRTMVLAVEVTPMAGAVEIAREDAVTDRDAYTKEMRQQRKNRRQEQRTRRRSNQDHEAAARAADADVAQPSEQPARVETRRPRARRAPVEALADAPVEALADAPVEALADAPVEVLADAPVKVLADAPVEVLN